MTDPSTQFPDLNLIEPLCNILKKHVLEIQGSASSINQCWKALQKVWDELLEEDILLHTGTMHEQVEAIKKANGWHIEREIDRITEYCVILKMFAICDNLYKGYYWTV